MSIEIRKSIRNTIENLNIENLNIQYYCDIVKTLYILNTLDKEVSKNIDFLVNIDFDLRETAL